MHWSAENHKMAYSVVHSHAIKRAPNGLAYRCTNAYKLLLEKDLCKQGTASLKM